MCGIKKKKRVFMRASSNNFGDITWRSSRKRVEAAPLTRTHATARSGRWRKSENTTESGGQATTTRPGAATEPV